MLSIFGHLFYIGQHMFCGYSLLISPLQV